MSADKPRRAILAEPQPNPEARRARVYEPGWKYTPKAESDIRKTFARVRKQLKEAAAAPVKPAKPIPVIHPERIAKGK